MLGSHHGWQGTPLGDTESGRSPYPNPVLTCSTLSLVEAKELYHREELVATILTKAPKAWTRRMSTALDDDASFLVLGNDKDRDRARMSPISKCFLQQVIKNKFLCPLEKNTQSETNFINKASDAGTVQGRDSGGGSFETCPSSEDVDQ